MEEIPLRKQPVLTKKLLVAVTEATYKEIYDMKLKGVNIPEWLRQVIASELPKLKKRI